jgi:hypothetical protein
MLIGNSIGGGVLGVVLMLTCASAWAFDDANYPDMKGQWTRMEVPGIARHSTPPSGPASRSRPH